ncbi:hypothetical protein EDB86DRAFT_2895343 [Lactarius hatsudake]|nr:hypothetical protein EDB86DRAFT_2895343 [Lactarius hatsudake]
MTLVLCSRSRFRRTVIDLIKWAKTRLRRGTNHAIQELLRACLAAAETTRVQLETHLHERGVTIECFEADHRWLAEHEQDEREGKEHISKEREGENTKADQDVRTLCSELSILKEDYMSLRKPRSSPPTSAVDSLSAELHASHDAAAAQRRGPALTIGPQFSGDSGGGPRMA